MIINTFEKSYYVIQKLLVTEDFEILICESKEELIKQKFIVNHIINSKIYYRLIPIFTEIFKMGKFKEFKDCFSRDGSVYLVFDYYDGINIKDKLKDDLNLREKLEIFKKLLEKIVVLDMPYNIQYDLLINKNIIVTENLEINFKYELNNYEYYEIVDVYNIQTAILQIYKEIFKEELENEISEEITNYKEKLTEHKKEMSYISMYKEFYNIYEMLLIDNNWSKLRPSSKAYKRWKKIYGLKRYFINFIKVFVIVLLLSFIIYSFMTPKVNEGIKFEQIGTVKVINKIE